MPVWDEIAALAKTDRAEAGMRLRAALEGATQ